MITVDAYELVQFEPGDAIHLQVQDAQAENVAEQVQSNPDYWKQLNDEGPAYTFRRGDRIIAIGGLLPQWEGRGIAWSVFGTDLSIIEIVRWTNAAYARIDQWQLDRQFQRLEATVYEPFIQGHKWIKRLGFVSEGIMRQYRLGEDHRLYARVRQWQR